MSFNHYKTLNKDELKKQIAKHTIIGFDIFDTLLKRNVQKPTDVFRLMEQKISCVGFAEQRIQAEKTARKNAGGEEITLTDIYSLMNFLNSERMMDAEICTEKCVLTINPMLTDIYDFCRNERKKIYIISDMYLPQSMIERVLSACGIDAYEKLYLSCERGKTKKTGTLFEDFLKTEKINPFEMLYIGDSYISDYKNPRKYGIDSYLIPHNFSFDQRIHNDGKLPLANNYLNAFVNNHLCMEDDAYYKFGLAAFGPFLWGYVKWLHKSFEKQHIEKVFFLARDGLIMQKAYKECFGENCVSNQYLEVSRRSLRVPVLWMDTHFETLLGMLSPSKMISIKSVFDGVGLDIEQYQMLLKKYNFTEKSVFNRNNISNNEMLRKMYEELLPDVTRISEREYKLLIDYLKQNNVAGKFAIVDIGWSGGMQRYLDQILNRLEIPHEIYGYYIGVAAYYKRNSEVVSNLNLNGYLFDYSHNVAKKDVRSGFVGLFESLFLEQNGSVKNYYMENNRIRAARYPHEYIQNGVQTPELKKIGMVQRAALDFIRMASSNCFLSEFKFSSDMLFENLYYCGAKPTQADLRLFADFKFYDEGVTTKLASPMSFGWYVVHPREFKQDFLQSRWKIGFMKKLFGLPLPYEKIYDILSRYK